MPEPAPLRTLLHGAAAGLLLFILLPAAERGLSALVIPLAEPAAALAVLLALALPALPLPHGSGRVIAALTGAAAALTAAFPPRAGTDLLALAAGTLWLGLAPRYLAPRALNGAVALAVAALPLQLELRPGAPVAVALALLATGLLGAAFARPQPAPATAERRAGAFRLRGLLAFSALLHLDALLRQALAPGWLATSAALAAGAAGALSVLLAPAPPPPARRELLLFAALVLLAALATTLGMAPLLSVAAAHALVVVLAARALVPAGGRRPRLHVSLAWLLWVGVGALAAYVGELSALAVAGAVAVAALALLPRTAAWRELAP